MIIVFVKHFYVERIYLRAGEMTHWLRELAGLLGAPSLVFSSILGSLNLTLAPRNLWFSSDLCTHMASTHIPTLKKKLLKSI